MEITTLGVGAMSAVYAGLMAYGLWPKGGHEVWALNIWQAQANAVNESDQRAQPARRGCQY
jgi:hypothetical protein